MYIGHISQDGRVQPLFDHLAGTAILAEQFASVFGAGPWGRLVGELHDIGKIQKQWQYALTHGKSLSMDHSTAGAQEAAELCGLMAAYCIAGHHSGLPNGESSAQREKFPSLMQRLQEKPQELSPLRGWIHSKFPGYPQLKHLGKGGYSVSFFIRMLYSCLVDADLTDTQRFLSAGQESENEYDDMLAIYGKFTLSIKPLLRSTSEKDQWKTKLIYSCSEQADLPPGLFSLTAPTGCDRTSPSLSFALRHAVKYNKQRVITVLPSTGDIDLTLLKYRKLLGDQNVIRHEADWGNDHREATPQSPPSSMRFSSENWDAPFIVTTNRAFFESFYSNQAFSCRKLHNVANSIILVKEAHMLPLHLLVSCMRVLTELVYNYGCTVLLYGIMPAALRPFLPPEIPMHELCGNHRELSRFYRLNHVNFLGKQTNEMMVSRLMHQPQALCIVNTCDLACNLYKRLRGEGCYLLTNLLYPEHRLRMLSDIRHRLSSGKPCHVISTSEAEIGMNLNFPAVFRSQSGLDRVIYAAGCCNRDELTPSNQCLVAVFQPEKKHRDSQIPSLSLSVEALETVIQEYEFPCSSEALLAYFRELYQQMQRLYPDQTVDILDLGIRSCRFPFVDIAENQRFFSEPFRAVMVPAGGDGQRIAQLIRKGKRDRMLMRSAGRYVIFLSQKQWDMLNRENALDVLDSELSVLSQSTCYREMSGLALALFNQEEN